MKKHTSWICLAALGLALLTQQGLSEDEPGVSPEQMQAGAADWMKLNQPGEPHKYLHSAVGEWDLTMRTWPNGPDKPPLESKGKSVITAILGGRFTQEKLQCSVKMPGPDGQMMEMPFEGVNTMGYDNYQKMFVSTWCDNMSTAIISMRGSRNPQTGVLTMYGQADEPMLGVHGRMVKSTVEPLGDGKGVYKMYDLHIADDYLMFEVIYERRQ